MFIGSSGESTPCKLLYASFIHLIYAVNFFALILFSYIWPYLFMNKTDHYLIDCVISVVVCLPIARFSKRDYHGRFQWPWRTWFPCSDFTICLNVHDPSFQLVNKSHGRFFFFFWWLPSYLEEEYPSLCNGKSKRCWQCYATLFPNGCIKPSVLKTDENTAI